MKKKFITSAIAIAIIAAPLTTVYGKEEEPVRVQEAIPAPETLKSVDMLDKFELENKELEKSVAEKLEEMEGFLKKGSIFSIGPMLEEFQKEYSDKTAFLLEATQERIADFEEGYSNVLEDLSDIQKVIDKNTEYEDLKVASMNLKLTTSNPAVREKLKSLSELVEKKRQEKVLSEFELLKTKILGMGIEAYEEAKELVANHPYTLTEEQVKDLDYLIYLKEATYNYIELEKEVSNLDYSEYEYGHTMMANHPYKLTEKQEEILLSIIKEKEELNERMVNYSLLEEEVTNLETRDYEEGYTLIENYTYELTEDQESKLYSLVEEKETRYKSNQGIVDLAYNQLGKPYVFGTAGPGTFDCSGLTSWLYRTQYGIYLPHSAYSQSNYGTYVSQSELQKGDLVFFATDGSGSVSHVGIYVGDGMMIHASTPSTGVILSTVYTSSYHSARRVR